jgi:hypothetical protein
MPFLVDGGAREVPPPEPCAAATPKRPLSRSASGVCLGRWPKPWGWTASPEAPHLGASGLRARNPRGRAAGRTSQRRARPLRVVAGEGRAARSRRTTRRGNLGPARIAAEGGAAWGSPKARHHYLPEGHGCGCRQRQLAHLARREVELGLPGLRRRPSVGVTPAGPDPPLVSTSRLAAWTLPRFPVTNRTARGFIRAEVGRVAATWRLRLITPRLARGLAHVWGPSWG